MKPDFSCPGKTSNRNQIAENLQAFHHFRFLSGGEFELSKFISATFSKLPFFFQLTFNWKTFSWYVFTFVQFFAIFSRKSWTAAEITSEGASKLLSPCRGQLFPKDSFLWKKYSFSINFCFEPIKLRFSSKSFPQSCQNCLVWCQRNTPRKNRFTE